MKREELLKNSGWWLAEIQNDLYAIIYEYMKKYDLKKKDIAEKLGVSKGYVTQILNGDFDHKISKMVEIALAFGKAPKVTYLDLEQYIKDDLESKLESECKNINFFIKVDSDSLYHVDRETFEEFKNTLNKIASIKYTYEEKNAEVTDFSQFDKPYELEEYGNSITN